MTTSTRTNIELLPTTDLSDALNDTLNQIITHATETTNAVKAPVISSFAQIFGTGGADNIHGTAADDEIFASGGNDTIEAGEGNDTIDGGDGDDYVDSHSGGNDVFYGGVGNDFYYGFTGNEKIYGDWGNDTLKGYSGDDVLEGGMGADYLDGGTGWDWASYATSKTGVSASLLLKAGYAGDANGDTLTNIESLTGSKFSDYLAGDDNGNVLDGAAGADVLYGNGGWDNVYGGEGNDTIDGGVGSDYLSGDGGNDTFKQAVFGSDYINGGAGSDTVDYSLVPKQWSGWTAGIEVNLNDGYAGYSRTSVHAGQNTGQDTLADIENVIGTKWNDLLVGNEKDNVFTSGGGQDGPYGNGGDGMYGNGGNDTFVMSANGAAWLDGGTGIDTVDYSSSTLSVVLTLDGNEANNYGAAAGTTAVGIENVIGGKVGDSIFGNAASNAINGMGGDDWIVGGYGGDVLTGGAGKDEFRFTSVTDSINDTNWGLRDKITDFTSGADHIDVWQIDANANINGNQSFNYLGDKAFTSAGQIRSYYQGDHTIVEFNTSDAAGAEMVIELSGHVALTAYDFVL